MNEQERYLFDLNGYLVIPDALSAGEVRALNDLWDEHIATDVEKGSNRHRWNTLLPWGKPFRDLIDHPSIYDHVLEMCGEGARLDHEYGDVIYSGKGPIGTTLHGGATPYDELFSYHFHNGRMHNGLIAIAFNLRDVNPGDGGFGCVPGSHKSNYPLPEEWREMEVTADVVERVTGPAGTAIIFTEALCHGTLPWNGNHERRTLFYKYSPKSMSWAARYYNTDDYPDLTDRQRALMEPPNARYPGREQERGYRRIGSK